MSLSGAAEQIVFSNGMGVESVAILLRWILEPESRNFPLSNLTVLTSMLGDEWDDAIEDWLKISRGAVNGEPLTNLTLKGIVLINVLRLSQQKAPLPLTYAD